MEATGIEAKVCADIAARQALGLSKYGVSVQDNNLPLREWLQHQYEELLDAAVYCRRAIEELDKERESIALKVEEMGMQGFGTLAIAAAIRRGND